MSTVSTRITKLEKTIRAKAKTEFVARVDADFAPALTRAAANEDAYKQIKLAQAAVIKKGTAAAENQALDAFLEARAPESPIITLDSLYKPATVLIAANGERLPDTAKNYVAVLLPQFDLLYTIGNELVKTQAAAVKAGSEIDLFDGKGQWQLWDDIEAQLTIDRSSKSPAVLAPFKEHTPTDYIYWTRRDHPSLSDSAYYVSLNSGSVNWSDRNGNGRVRACRRVRASQNLAFGAFDSVGVAA